jgi:hypothetical protein
MVPVPVSPDAAMGELAALRRQATAAEERLRGLGRVLADKAATPRISRDRRWPRMALRLAVAGTVLLLA